MQFFSFSAFSLAMIAVASANPGGVVNTGASAVSRTDDGYGNFNFGYNEDHATGGSFRKEKGGPGVQVGSYGLRDADGRMRVVNYVADALGFRASVSTNEPGVDSKQDPAAANLNGGHIPVVAPAPVYAAAEHGYGAHGAVPAYGAHGVATGYGAHGVGPAYGAHGGAVLAAPAHVAAPVEYSVATQHVSAGPVFAAAGHGVAHY